MRLPELFLVGAPRCGTTAMNDYLAQHPEIFMAEKELHHFGADLDFRHRRPTRQEYSRFFARAQKNQLLGEASVWYLYSRSAAREIREACPSARILIMLRNPIDVMYSLHGHRLFLGSENIADFEQALSAEADRLLGRRVPEGRFLVDGLFYRKVVRFVEQVERYFEAFGRSRVHVILYDDFRARTLETYQGAVSFLSRDARFTPRLGVVNEARRIRHVRLRDFLRLPPPLARRVARVVPPHARRTLSRRLLRALGTPAMRPPLDPRLRATLVCELRPGIEALGRLLGRDLSQWLDG